MQFVRKEKSKREISKDEEPQENSDQYDYEEDSNDPDLEDEADQKGEPRRLEIALQEAEIWKKKVGELQKICQTLSTANNKLFRRVEQLESMLHEKNKLIQKEKARADGSELQIMDIDLGESDEILREYLEEMQQKFSESRLDFENYRKKILEEISRKDQKICELSSVISQLTEQAAYYQQSISELKTTNEDLLAGFEAETVMRTYNQESPERLSYFDTTFQNQFDREVRLKLEKMIDQLMVELSFERKHAKRTKEEAKRLGMQVLSLERELKHKNSKLYNLQLETVRLQRINQAEISIEPNQHYSAIQTGRIYSPRIEQRLTDRKLKNELSLQRLNPNRYMWQSVELDSNFPSSTSDLPVHKVKNSNKGSIQPISPGTLPKNTSQPKMLKSFTLIQMMEENIELSIKETLILLRKVVEFYNRKISRSDYTALMLENLLVANFNHVNPNLIQIKKEGDSFDQNSSEAGLVMNLGFVVNSIVSRVSAEKLNEKDQGILSLSRSIMEGQQANATALKLLQKAIEQSIKTRQ